MTFTVLIPARLASTRLPNKPLADIGGVPMVVRVAQRVLSMHTETFKPRVVVAADSAEIVSACQAHGIDVLLTRVEHTCGSDRLAEACDLLKLDDEDIVVNVQGDEPLINTGLVLAVANLLKKKPLAQISTAAHAITAGAKRAACHSRSTGGPAYFATVWGHRDWPRNSEPTRWCPTRSWRNVMHSGDIKISGYPNLMTLDQTKTTDDTLARRRRRTQLNMIIGHGKCDCHSLLKSQILTHITRYGDLPLAGDCGLHAALSKKYYSVILTQRSHCISSIEFIRPGPFSHRGWLAYPI